MGSLMGWFKLNGLEALSAEDQTWAKRVKRSSRSETLLECARKNQPARIKFLWKNFHFSPSHLIGAAEGAIDSQSPEALLAVVEHDGFDFFHRSSGNKETALRLFEKTKSSLPCFKILWFKNSLISSSQIANILSAEDTSPEVLNFFLDKTLYEGFNALISQAAKDSAEKLRFILAWANRFPESQPHLSHVLALVAQSGDVEKALLLLNKAADPNHDCARSLFRAVEYHKKEMFDLLLPLVKLDLHGEDVIAKLKQRNSTSPLLPCLEEAVSQAAKQKLLKQEENHVLIDRDTIAEVQKLPAGMTLTTLFNFKSGQQTVIVEKTGEKASLAVSVREFHDIGNDGLIESMRLKLIELGGTAESDTRLQKPRIILK